MTTAILVSHGQPSDPEVGEAEIATLAAKVAAQTEFAVSGVTLAAPDALETLLDRHPHSLIYPMFMTGGWFTRTALPRRIGDRPARLLAPFGTDPALPGAVAACLAQYCADQGWEPEDTPLAVLGHGSGRSAVTAQETEAFARSLATHFPTPDLRLGYVEQSPWLTDALRDLPSQSLALPFFAARRGHVLDDLPEAAAKMNFSGHMLDPVGLLDIVPVMIAQQLTQVAQSDPCTAL